MQAMTPEQNEQWQRAINPLDYLDFHALSEDGLQECAQRLSSWGVPGWAWRLRASLMEWGSDHLDSWCPNFAIRSEIALVGIQILNKSDELAPVYQRVFMRYSQEGLRPIVEHIRRQGDTLEARYQPLLTLYRLCETFVPPANLNEWPEVYTLFPNPRFPMLGASKEKSKYQEPGEVADEPLELSNAFQLGRIILLQIHSHLNPESRISWNNSYSGHLVATIKFLNWMHQWCLEGKSATGTLSKRVAPGSYDANYKHLIADAFLTALEAECPPPDWLLRI